MVRFAKFSDFKVHIKQKKTVSHSFSLSLDDDGVLREVWFNLGLSPLLTTLTNNPRFPSSPDEYIVLDKFEAPPNAGDGYGQRLSSYFKVNTYNSSEHRIS